MVEIAQSKNGKGLIVMIHEVNVSENRVQVVWSGIISAADAEHIQERYIEYINKGYSMITIDLSAITYIDCVGIGVLVSIYKAARKKGVQILIKGQQGAVEELFLLLNLHKLFCLPVPIVELNQVN